MTANIPVQESTLQTLFQKAVAQHKAGQLQEAGELYLAILQSDPHHSEANHNMGMLAVQMNLPAAGLPYFTAALDAEPARGQYWLDYIDALFQAGQLEDARQVLELAKQQGLQGAEAEALGKRLHDGVQIAEKHDTENLQAGSEAQPVPPAVPQDSQISPGRKEISALLDLFNQGRYTEAATLAQAMTEQFPLNEFGWKALGAALKQLGRSTEALVPMKKAVELSPRDAEAHYNLGATLADLGFLDEAETSYRRALRINPAYADALSNLGVLLHRLGRLAEAEASLRSAVEIKPHDPQVHRNLGVALHDLGRLNEAEASYRKSLEFKSDNSAEVRFNLGNTLREMGRLNEAEATLRQALEMKPDFAEAHSNLGNTLRELGRLDEAEASYRRALQIKPDYSKAHYNLGNVLMKMGRPDQAELSYGLALQFNPDLAEAHGGLGITLMDLGRLKEAETSLRRALEIQPNYAEALRNLGAVLEKMGRTDEAEASFRQALQIKADYPGPQEISSLLAVFSEGRHNEAATLAQTMTMSFPLHQLGWKILGMALKQLERNTEALAPMQKAAALSPGDAVAQFNLGATLQDLNRLDEAETSYRQAIQIKPSYADAHYNLGNALIKMGRLKEAETCFRHALRTDPDYAAAYSNLGVVLQRLGCLDEAEETLRRALLIKPGYADAYCNLGLIFQEQGRLNEAESSYRQALEIEPNLAETRNNLGVTLQDLGRLDEAEACYRQALRIKPDYAVAFSNLLFVLNYHPDKSAEEIFEAYREYDVKFAQPCHSEWRPHGNSRNTQRRLKVGYVSPDFRNHSIRHFLEPLLARHDKNAFEVYAYAQLTRHTTSTDLYKNYVDHWIPTLGLSDNELVERIRADGIDILVDLAGHTAQNRLSVFARRPAPVSVSWLGFGYSTGLTAIDYFLTDKVSAPAGCEHLFAEKLWRLPTPMYIYRPADGMGDANPLPALSAGYVTFGTLTRRVRINHRVVRVWSEILRSVDGAQLVIDSKNFREAYSQDLLIEKFAAHGIGRDRLHIGCHSPPWDLMRGLDIGLDCFPHNSGTTLFETLYMGIPFITLSGRPSVGRLGSSILEGVRHPEWIVRSEDDYVEKAVALAKDLPKLASLRATLRHEMQASPLMDESAFAREVETAYREMFETWARK